MVLIRERLLVLMFDSLGILIGKRERFIHTLSPDLQLYHQQRLMSVSRFSGS